MLGQLFLRYVAANILEKYNDSSFFIPKTETGCYSFKTPLKTYQTTRRHKILYQNVKYVQFGLEIKMCSEMTV